MRIRDATLLLCLLAAPAFAADEGRIIGCVVDGETGAPVTQARITIREAGFLPANNYTDDNGCTWANVGTRPSYPPKIQVDVESGPGFMPFYGYPSIDCETYPASPPYVECWFTIQLVPRLSVTATAKATFRPSAE